MKQSTYQGGFCFGVKLAPLRATGLSIYVSWTTYFSVDYYNTAGPCASTLYRHPRRSFRSFDLCIDSRHESIFINITFLDIRIATRTESNFDQPAIFHSFVRLKQSCYDESAQRTAYGDKEHEIRLPST